VRTYGKYRLIEPLASGGMADVWRAETVGAAGVVKEVALKLVRGEHEARSEFVQMFIEEARLASRLTHANVVQVFEFDQIDGRYYIAMELVRGRHLGRVLERARERGLRLGLARAVHVGAEVARALAYAHRTGEGGAGVVHRDVSPHNVLVSFEGEVKLADFGIARAMSRAGLTDPGTVKGKLAYMAPEQARGATVDGRADVFSLGVILWELCAGRRLFARDSDAATLSALLEGPPPSPPSAWNEAVPPALDRAILGALARDPAARTPSAEALARALGQVLLEIARSPEDFDLRAFMRRLWEGEAEDRPAAPLPGTQVRPRPTPGPSPAPRPTPPAAAPGEADGGEPSEDEPTRTATVVGPPRPPRRAALGRAGIVAGVALLAVGAAVLGPRLRARPPAAPSRQPSAPGQAASAAASSSAAPSEAPAASAVEGSGAAVAAAPAPAPASPERPAASVPVASASPPTPSAPARSAVAELGGLELVLPGPAANPASPPTPDQAGVLQVTSSPWAYVFVDGRRVGETPVAVPLPPGRYRVRAVRAPHGVREAWVEIAPGRRTAWSAVLGR
jgi:serine/threonine-protein kinase